MTNALPTVSLADIPDGDELVEMEPCSASLDCLADALDSTATLIRRFVYLSPVAADVLALFVTASYVPSACETATYLHVVSPEPRCGKTTLLECLELLVSEPVEASAITTAALVRLLAEKSRTLLLDEIDRAFQRDREFQATMTGVLNAGYRAGKHYIACERVGDDYQTRAFPVFGPKVLAGIRNLPGTIEDRCLPIRLERKPPEARVLRFKRRIADKLAAPIRGWFKAWAPNQAEALRTVEPELPRELNDRQQDVAEPLLAIAESAGREWPGRARAAIIAVCRNYDAEPSLSARLLADVRMIFDERGVQRISTADLVAALGAMESAPWGDYRDGHPLADRDLAALLRPYQIEPRKLRIGGQTPQGYDRAQFETAWKAYVPVVGVD